MVKKPDIDIKKFKKLLVERQKYLADIIESSVHTNANIELDETETGRLTRMDAIQQHAMEGETDRRRDQELVRIEAALERIASGDYGFCAACDEKIAIKRLESDPSTPICVNCASKAEASP